MKLKLLLSSFLVLCSVASAQKFDGLALTPPMGWNSWNTFASNINEDLIKETAEAMIVVSRLTTVRITLLPGPGGGGAMFSYA
jgi:hypothetical protein